MQPVEVRERQEARLLAGSHEVRHRGARATVGCDRFACRLVLDEVERPEHAQAAHLAYARMALASSASPGPSTFSPIQAAFSTIPSSFMALMVATAAAHASGWPE